MLTISSAHDLLSQAFERAGYSPSAATQAAWWLLQELTGFSRLQSPVGASLTTEQGERLVDWFADIAQHKPLAYIVGHVPFCGLKITVRPPVLIPRPETEEWVTALIEQLKPITRPLEILDVGTGSGCIALALASHLPQVQVTALDCAQPALALARENARALGLSNVTVLESDLFAALTGKTFDVIVSNPPYIARHEYEQLSPDVAAWEDKGALCAGSDGLAVIRRLIAQMPAYVRANAHMPQLVMEIDRNQTEQICALLTQHGYTGVTVKKDLSGADRVVYAQVSACGHLPAQASLSHS